MAENIKISCGKSATELSDYEKGIIEKLTIEYREKLERHFENILKFEVYVKCFSKEGNVKRYQIDSKLIVPGYNFEASSDEHDLSKAVHKTLKKLMNEVEKKVKISNQGNLSRRPQNFRKRR
ncbi:MAG: hypothetical protein Q8N99_07395 [Nanoarchaeota archaeon]|nr:hypothetical protein [Nanoarchaeota archaeon]